MQKATLGSFQNDMTRHFDRMWPKMTSIFATKFGVSKNIMLSIGEMIGQLKRNVKTALGVSTANYSQATSSSRIGGMVQVSPRAYTYAAHHSFSPFIVPASHTLMTQMGRCPLT